MATLVGQTVSHYTILEHLGGGGMGVVYKAQDLKLDRLVALKFLPPELTRDVEAQQRFVHEAKAASSLQHNNICVVYDIDETSDGQMFIAMEYVEGETLKKKIERGPLNIDEAIDLTIQLALGVKKAHEHSIIHRDIKPANIMITGDGEAKIVDFGLAKLGGRTMLTKTGSTLGTAAYMSPEQARGESADHRTDIWSLGVVLYEMLTGRQPFAAEYENALLYSILNVNPEPVTGLRTGIPMDLERIVEKCLAKGPHERYQHADELLVDVRNVKQNASSPATPRRKRGRPHMLIGGGLALLLAVLAAVVWMLAPSGDKQTKNRKKSIAILPFTPISHTEQDEAFAEGIHDQLLTQLSGIHDLLVISRQSVRQYKESQKRTRDIARELDVRLVMEGSVQTIQNTVRMQVQLIDGETEGHLWAKTYTREFQEIFKVQGDIAENVAAALQSTITPEERDLAESVPTANKEAFECYARANYYWLVSANYEGNKKAYELYEKAAELDPQFAQAFAMASIVHVAFTIPPWDTSGNHLEKARERLRTAERLAPDLPETKLARGVYFRDVDQDAERALREFEAVLAMRPNDSETLQETGFVYVARRDLNRAEDAFRRAEEIDPLTVWAGMDARHVCLAKREWEKTRILSRQYITRHPDDIIGYLGDAMLLVYGFGDLDGAQQVLNEGMGLPTPSYRFPVNALELKEFHARLERYRRNDDAAVRIFRQSNLRCPPELVSRAFPNASGTRRYLDSLRVRLEREVVDNRWSLSDLSMVLAALGEKERAIACAENRISRVPKVDYWMEREQGEENLLQVCVLTGAHARALNMIDDLLSRPGFLTTWKLRLDPVYDPLRANPRFQALLARYERM